jgi:hypothetical protein
VPKSDTLFGSYFTKLDLLERLNNAKKIGNAANKFIGAGGYAGSRDIISVDSAYYFWTFNLRYF